MQTTKIKENKHFIGRSFELKKLAEIAEIPEASIIVVYGRRRVGKTELLEQAYRHRHLLKFEGIEGEDEPHQLKHVLMQLARYTQDPIIANVHFEHWTQFFELLAKYIAQGEWTLYFEETQWLACYKNTFISELKYAWDNYFRHNSRLKIILCGSSPSFMVNQVVHSKALYSRSVYEMHIQPFSIQETQSFLPKSGQRELMDAFLTIGGIPEYLKRIKNDSSLLIGICKNSFEKDGYFSTEYQKIFISSLSNNKYYKKIIDLLSKHHFMARQMIANKLGIKSGGQLTDLLNDLELCGFIQKYIPYHQKPGTLLTRYCIQDRYLDFYFKFIASIQSNILSGQYNENPMNALELSRYQKWLGFAFERYCRENHATIAKILGFSGIRYRHGAYFNRNTEKIDSGFQIDLVFERADNVVTVCEIKYLHRKVGIEVIQDVENKLVLFQIPASMRFQKVLISVEGPSDTLIARNYFDRFIALKELIKG